MDTKADDQVYGDARKGAKQWQEDSFGFKVSKNRKCFVMGVFDGHGGYNGLIASSTARETLLSFFTEHSKKCESWDNDEWRTQLRELFKMTQAKIRQQFLDQGPGAKPIGRVVDANGVVRSATGDPIHGGTTGSVVVAIKENDGTYSVIGCNVGDSTAVLISEKGTFQFLSTDHGPDNADEFKRIRDLDVKKYPKKLIFVYDKAKCYKKYECPKVFTEEGTKDSKFVTNPWGNGLHPTNVRYEPAVYAVTPQSVTKDATCIAMTRALGDFYAGQFGLSCEPSFSYVRTKKGEDFVVSVCSDGIWDCWRYENYAKYIVSLWKEKKMNMAATTETALTETVSRAISNFGASHYDDASMLNCELPARTTS